MSKRLGTLMNTGSRNIPIDITSYVGPDGIGLCVQLTAEMEDREIGYIQLNSADIIKLIYILKENIINPTLAVKREKIKRTIAENQELERTIIKDIIGVNDIAINEPIMEMSSLLSFGEKEFVKEGE